MDKPKTLNDLKESDYEDKWVTTVNDEGETVHSNDILGITLTIPNWTDDEIKQKFYSQDKTD